MTCDRTPLRLLVFGGRDFADRKAFSAAIKPLFVAHDLEIVCGYDPDDSRFQGADQLAYEFAKAYALPVFTFPAAWHRLGRSAGPRRNSRMRDDAQPDKGLGFPRANGDWGPGSMDMKSKLQAAGIEVIDAIPTTPPQGANQ